jgi:hypothetical protein
VEEMRNGYKMLVGKPEEGHYSEDIGVGRRIILERILQE